MTVDESLHDRKTNKTVLDNNNYKIYTFDFIFILCAFNGTQNIYKYRIYLHKN